MIFISSPASNIALFPTYIFELSTPWFVVEDVLLLLIATAFNPILTGFDKVLLTVSTSFNPPNTAFAALSELAIFFVVFVIFVISGKKSRISESAYSGETDHYRESLQTPYYSDKNEIILYEDDESPDSNIIIQDAIPIRKRR